MNASFVDLRKRTREIIEALKRNERVTLFYRGKPTAIMHAVQSDDDKTIVSARDHAAFGLWADRNDMDDIATHVRNLRKGRFSGL